MVRGLTGKQVMTEPFQSSGGPGLASHEHLPGQTLWRPRHRVTCICSGTCTLARGPGCKDRALTGQPAREVQVHGRSKVVTERWPPQLNTRL